MSQLTPEVLWAQRSSSADPEKNFIYLTISVPDVPKESFKLDLKPTTLSFSGKSNTLKRDYTLNLEFYDEIDVDGSQISHTARNVELKLRKKDLKEEYWPRLLKEAKKVQFLKTDFDKWVDEDEQNEAPEEDFSQFGGAGGAGGGGMGGMPGMGGDFGGIDFSKLGGGGGGMPDFGSMGGLGGEDDEDDEDEDDDMPALEGEDDAKPADTEAADTKAADTKAADTKAADKPAA